MHIMCKNNTTRINFKNKGAFCEVLDGLERKCQERSKIVDYLFYFRTKKILDVEEFFQKRKRTSVDYSLLF